MWFPNNLNFFFERFIFQLIANEELHAIFETLALMYEMVVSGLDKTNIRL